MSIQVQCGQCGKQYAAPDAWAGRRAKCLQCGAEIEVPVPIAELAPAAPEDELLDPEMMVQLTSPGRLAGPFPATPAPASPLGPSRTLPPRRPTKSSQPSIPGMLWAPVLSQKLIVAILLAVGIVLVWQVGLLVTSGLGRDHIGGAILLVAGVVILVGGLRGSPHRNRSKDKARAARVAGWFIASLAGTCCACIAMLVVAKQGVEVAAVARYGAPFLVVFALAALVCALILVYYLLVLWFPKVNVFRIAAWGYVVFTVVLPLAGFVAGVLSGIDQAAKERAAVQQAEQSQQSGDKSLAQGPPGLPPGTPAPPSSSASDEGSSPPTEQVSGAASAPSRPPPDEAAKTASAPPGPASGATPGPDRALDRFGRPGGFAGPGYRPPMHPSADPSTAGGPPAGPRAPGFFGSGPPDLDAQRQKLIDQFGADKVVTITVRNLPSGSLVEVSRKARSAADAEGHLAHSSGSLATITVAPVDDFEAFRAKLDIGKVTEVDRDRRTITVDAQAGQ